MEKIYITLSLVLSLIYNILGQKNTLTENDKIGEFEEYAISTKIVKVNEKYSFKELAELIEIAKNKCNKSDNIVENLSLWLEENHPIYQGKNFNEVLQFRAYLIYSFSFFNHNAKVLKYILYELTYSDNQNVIGATIHLSKNYADERLLPLIEKFTKEDYNINVNFLNFDLQLDYTYHSTIQKEAIKSLASLQVNSLSETKPSCCSSKIKSISDGFSKMIERRNRAKMEGNMFFLDQYSNQTEFRNFYGKPFIVTFFYTSCTNQNKCANTISKLSELQKQISGRRNRFGIYAITYDDYLDKPDILKKYGDSYNFMFNENNKFLVSVDSVEMAKTNYFFTTKVNYGSGTVNQHGIQLFLFDKQGKVAQIFDNESWSVSNILDKIKLLVKE